MEVGLLRVWRSKNFFFFVAHSNRWLMHPCVYIYVHISGGFEEVSANSLCLPASNR